MVCVCVLNYICSLSLSLSGPEERAEYKKDRALLGSQNFTDKKQRSPSPGDPSMQVDMAKAVQDSEILKAVVVPLEKVWRASVYMCVCVCMTQNAILLTGDSSPTKGTLGDQG